MGGGPGGIPKALPIAGVLAPHRGSPIPARIAETQTVLQMLAKPKLHPTLQAWGGSTSSQEGATGILPCTRATLCALGHLLSPGPCPTPTGQRTALCVESTMSLAQCRAVSWPHAAGSNQAEPQGCMAAMSRQCPSGAVELAGCTIPSVSWEAMCHACTHMHRSRALRAVMSLGPSPSQERCHPW